MSAVIERAEPVLNVRDVAASTTFYGRLGFVERFRDSPESCAFGAYAIRVVRVAVVVDSDAVVVRNVLWSYRVPRADIVSLRRKENASSWVASAALALERRQGLPIPLSATTPANAGLNYFRRHNPQLGYPGLR
jgi:hypothetical protein